MNSSNSWRVSNMSSCPKLRIEGFTDAWEQRKLESISADYKYSIVDGPFGSDLKTADYTEEGVLVMQSNYITGGKFEIKQPYFVSIDKAEQLLRCHCKGGDILIAKIGANFGICNIIPENIEDAVLSSNCMKVDLDEKHDNDFYKHYFNLLYDTGYYYSIVGITAQPALSLKLMKNLDVPSPTLEEQLKIAEFFNDLDNLITLHQRKSDALKNAKKYFLKNMFPSEGEKLPKLRLEGFTDAWEQRKLGEYIIEYKEVTTQNDQYPPLTSSRRGIFLQTEYFDGNQIASKDNVGYNIVPYGYFTYRHMSDDDIFHFNINTIVENGIVSTLYPVFTTNNELDSKYLQYQLNYGHEFAKYAIMQKQGGSRTYMYLNKLKQLYITMPLSVDEQKKISFFFSKLDDLITLHQRKCDALKNAKKFFLQNMFV